MIITVFILSNALIFTGAIYAVPVFARTLSPDISQQVDDAPSAEQHPALPHEEESSNSSPDSEPGTIPDSEQSTLPDSDSGTLPVSEPGTPSDTEPSTPPDSEPGTPSDTEPGTPPDSEPGTPSDTEPGTPPDSEPGTPSDTEPGTLPEPEPAPQPEPESDQQPVPELPVIVEPELPDWRTLSPEEWSQLSDELKEELIQQIVENWRDISPEQWDQLPKAVKDVVISQLAEDWRNFSSEDWEHLPKEVKEAIIQKLLDEWEELSEDDLARLPEEVLIELFQRQAERINMLMGGGGRFPAEPEVGGFVIALKSLKGKNLFTEPILAETSTRNLEPQAELNLDDVEIRGLNLYKNFTAQGIPFHIQITTKNENDLVKITGNRFFKRDLENRVSEMYAKRMEARVLGFIPIILHNYWTTTPEVDLLLLLANLLSFTITVDVDDMLLNTHLMRAEKIVIQNLVLNIGRGHLSSYVP